MSLQGVENAQEAPDAHPRLIHVRPRHRGGNCVVQLRSGLHRPVSRIPRKPRGRVDQRHPVRDHDAVHLRTGDGDHASTAAHALAHDDCRPGGVGDHSRLEGSRDPPRLRRLLLRNARWRLTSSAAHWEPPTGSPGGRFSF